MEQIYNYPDLEGLSAQDLESVTNIYAYLWSIGILVNYIAHEGLFIWSDLDEHADMLVDTFGTNTDLYRHNLYSLIMCIYDACYVTVEADTEFHSIEAYVSGFMQGFANNHIITSPTDLMRVHFFANEVISLNFDYLIDMRNAFRTVSQMNYYFTLADLDHQTPSMIPHPGRRIDYEVFGPIMREYVERTFKVLLASQLTIICAQNLKLLVETFMSRR